MRFVQIAGASRTGKTTTMLNLRKGFGALYGKEKLTYLPDHRILFIGPGLNKRKYRRRVGTDKIGRNLQKLEAFLEQCVLGQFPDDTIVIMDTFLPILNSSLLENHEKIVKFCYVSEEQLSQRYHGRRTAYFLNKQEKYLAHYKRSASVLTIWPSELSLSERVKDIAETIGLKESIAPIVDFKRL